MGSSSGRGFIPGGSKPESGIRGVRLFGCLRLDSCRALSVCHFRDGALFLSGNDDADAFLCSGKHMMEKCENDKYDAGTENIQQKIFHYRMFLQCKPSFRIRLKGMVTSAGEDEREAVEPAPHAYDRRATLSKLKKSGGEEGDFRKAAGICFLSAEEYGMMPGDFPTELTR